MDLIFRLFCLCMFGFMGFCFGTGLGLMVIGLMLNGEPL